ncbi:MAG: hypothetical protein DMF68_22070 [Acidobacteria bacterium]|nr:MAG: hypothetical protein DMF68_22070 [Acidobacteriota bacterium]
MRRETLHIAIQVASALHGLHRVRLIHRDVKPANIFSFHLLPINESNAVRTLVG